jgi:hypothetical protein
VSMNPPKPGHLQSYSDLGGYECLPDCPACAGPKCACGNPALEGGDKCGVCLLKAVVPTHIRSTYSKESAHMSHSMHWTFVEPDRARIVGHAVLNAFDSTNATTDEMLTVMYVITEEIKRVRGILTVNIKRLDDDLAAALKNRVITRTGNC